MGEQPAPMCRFLATKSTAPVRLRDLILKPAHSIIKQSEDSRLRLDQSPVNADGFGVGWYDQSEDDASDVSDSNTPCIFLAITPAWSNRNLHRLADKVRSQLIFAHVRAATQAPLSEENCHPWSYGSLLWMHNGLIGGWSRKKRHLQALLSDEFYNF